MSGFIPKVYGENLSGGPIDVVAFFKKPLVISRITSLLTSIVVFSTIISGGWNIKGQCILNAVSSNCNFVTFVGITAMLISVAFLVTDFIIPHISSNQNRKVIVIADIAIACLYSLFWLISMGVIIAEWWKTELEVVRLLPYWQFRCIQAAAAFSIFSLAIWVVIVFFATRRFHLGKTELFPPPAYSNYVNNANFDDIGNRPSGGGYSNPSMQDAGVHPYSISAQINNETNPSTKPTVLY